VSNPYLVKLYGVMGTHGSQNLKARHVDEPSKPSKPSFEGFEGDQGRPFLDFGCRDGEAAPCGIELTQAKKSAAEEHFQNPQNLSAYASAFAALRQRCPDHVEPLRWHEAVKDGHRWLAEWGEQAEALGWTAHDLFGLHEVPTRPHPSYQRLSRYDCTGLIWLLRGCPVVALTATTATIKSAIGNITTYRRRS
jgi:hypothetical protein